ncbi:hypothetical protein [Nocardia wallacei]|uniref:hypothetical protein n=1 Tax=Nocardia wallacei TaxID=480035 RepID=UPI0024562F21|nr:hypothetical protein [Nocardia wallacei]
MATATLVLDNVSGYPGLARVYRVSPPLLYDGAERDHVLVWVREPRMHRAARVSVMMSTQTGAPIEGSMLERPGSFTAHGNPFGRLDHREGCFAWALLGAGQAEGPGAGSPTGFVITEAAD